MAPRRELVPGGQREGVVPFVLCIHEWIDDMGHVQGGSTRAIPSCG